MPRVNATGYWDASDYGSTPLYTAALPGEKPAIGVEERRVLRELAARVARLAAEPRQEEMRRLWLRHNRLEPTRPLDHLRPRERLERDHPRRGPGLLLPAGPALGDGPAQGAVLGGADARRPADRSRSSTSATRPPTAATGSRSATWTTPRAAPTAGSLPWSGRADLDRLRFPRLQVDQDTTRSAAELAREVFAACCPCVSPGCGGGAWG